MAKKDGLSIYISFILRHKPEEAGLHMDRHGWVLVEELIDGINKNGKYKIDAGLLRNIVETDKKGRYRYNEDGTKIKACQGHSIPWVEPELTYQEPPEFVYHGTTTEAFDKIMESGFISKMNRHAVHMQADVEKAWQSALRWKKKPVVLKIAAGQMYEEGFIFGVSDNQVWCTERVPVSFIIEVLEKRD